MFQTDPLAIQSKGLQVKMSPNEKGYKSKCPQMKRATSQNVPNQKVHKNSEVSGE